MRASYTINNYLLDEYVKMNNKLINTAMTITKYVQNSNQSTGTYV